MSALLDTVESPDFWDWSLEVYRREGVADTLLQMQDGHGVDVNLVLWCIWAGKYYAELEEESVQSILSQTEDWAASVTEPVRAVRRRLKAGAGGMSARDVENLYRRLKAAELESERMTQTALAAATRAAAGPYRHARTTNAWRYNFDLYCAHEGLAGAGGLSGDAAPGTLMQLYLRVLKLIFPDETLFF